MKFQIETATLKSTLSRMVAVTERRVTIPITQNVLMQSDAGQLLLRATDLDVQLTERVAIDAATDGATTVNAVMLKGIIDKLPDSLTNIEVKDDVLHIKSGKSRFKLNTLPAEDFPILASDQFESVITFDGEQFKSAIDRTIWATSKEETRYYLNGIAMQSRDNKTVFVATDGHRLSKFETPVSDNSPDIIIPTKTAKLFSGVVLGEAVVHVSSTKVKLVTGNVEVLSKVIDATYPDWTRVIPQGQNNKVTAQSLDLKFAVDRVQTVMDDRTKIVAIDISDDGITITGGSGNNQATDSVEGDMNGAPIKIGVNGKYALDAMMQADKGDVTISYSDAGSPMVVTYEKEPNMLAVIMPARLTSY